MKLDRCNANHALKCYIQELKEARGWKIVKVCKMLTYFRKCYNYSLVLCMYKMTLAVPLPHHVCQVSPIRVYT